KKHPPPPPLSLSPTSRSRFIAYFKIFSLSFHWLLYRNKPLCIGISVIQIVVNALYGIINDPGVDSKILATSVETKRQYVGVYLAASRRFSQECRIINTLMWYRNRTNILA
uniref:Bestrophin homolog n=1 Tax=Ascaris lumbricoides TaxID=6252 RepID=A0A0M3IM29_ASCLU